MGASAEPTGLSQAEPSSAVSALRASIPRAADAEIDAIRDAYVALSRASPAGQIRALDWLSARFGWEHRVAGEMAVSLGASLRRIELAVRRERRRRDSASAIEAATAGETVQQGSTEGESAVPDRADAQPPSGDS
jgi:hypothetical protein